MQPGNTIVRTNCWNSLASLVAIAVFTLPTIGNTQIVQTVNSAGTTTEWNDAIWGSPAALPIGGNNYVSAVGLAASSSTSLGAGTDVTGRVRAYGGANGNPTFVGGSLTLVPGTELLIKDNGATYTANLILNGGIVRMSPNSAGSLTLAGMISVFSDSVLGLVQASPNNTFRIASTITGSSTLRLATGQNTGHTITFDDGAGLSLNGFSGTFDVGGGSASAIVDFNWNYNMSLAGLRMGNYSTADVLNLDGNISVGSFSFGGASLPGGIYDTSTLNGMFGNGSQFSGLGTLTVIAVPEPSSMALACFGGLLMVAARRRANC